MSPLLITQNLVVPTHALHWTAVRASGPGGQNVNKVASKVTVWLDLSSEVFSNELRARIQTNFAGRIDSTGRLQVMSQKTRDQTRNLEDARDKLRALVRVCLEVPKPRKATRPSRAAARRRLGDKQHLATKKAYRRVERDD